MATKGFWVYVPGEPGAGRALRNRLNQIAKEMGYTAPSGYTTGRGSVTQLLQAIDAGEVALVLLSDEERRRALSALQDLAAADPVCNEWAASMLSALERAMQRERDADRDAVMDQD